MKFKEKISINEFDDKRFQTWLVEPNLYNQKKAVLTHYLHNIGTGVSKHFKKEAEKAIKEYVTYKNKEEYLSLVAEDALQQLLFEVNDVPFPTTKNYTFKFIDLFAGIGGFRIAMQNLGGKCVFTSEWDKEAQRTYRANFGEVPFGDITKEQTKKFIPDGGKQDWTIMWNKPKELLGMRKNGYEVAYMYEPKDSETEPERVVNDWIKSEGHRKCIIEEGWPRPFKRMGVGVYKGVTTVWFSE